MIRIAAPACIFLSLSTLTSITLNGLKLFVLPASGELAFKGMIIICMVLLFKGYGIIGAVIGVVAGSVARFCVHLTKLYRKNQF
ncbi:MAG: polysaccharide biosynthesis C-terminal domain-containing protein [Mangrovibacterium sp.]